MFAGNFDALERSAVAGELDEDVDDRLDDGRVEHVGGRFVVPLRDTLAEVILGYGRAHSSKPCGT